MKDVPDPTAMLGFLLNSLSLNGDRVMNGDRCELTLQLGNNKLTFLTWHIDYL